MKFLEFENDGEHQWIKFNGQYVTNDQICILWMIIIAVLTILSLSRHS